MSVEGLDEEDQLFITLKASMHTALEEQATRVASLILTELQVAYPVSLFLLIFLSLYKVEREMVSSAPVVEVVTSEKKAEPSVPVQNRGSRERGGSLNSSSRNCFP